MTDIASPARRSIPAPRPPKAASGTLISVVGIVVLLVTWIAAVRLFSIPAYILPRPEAVLTALWSGL
ncbi:hypothetical protein ABTH71_20235, partial [Acinetobacter baumannii]